MTSETVIEVKGLRRSYGPVRAVQGVDLVVHRGEVMALLGPNGAGKTTTVEILEGYRRRDAGAVRVLGEDPQRAGRAWRARRGVVLQDSKDLDDLRVAECVSQFAAFYPDPARPGELVDRVGLAHRSNALVRALSGGERRRLDVALGLVGQPELLFLDEPTTGFDPEARRGFWTLVRDLRAEGTTVMLTTHYLDEAEALADRVGVIRGGRVVACAPPGQIGARAGADAWVAWRGPAGPERVRTAEPAALVAGLHARFGGEPPGLTVTRPSLEDAYLELIGSTGAGAHEGEQ